MEDLHDTRTAKTRGLRILVAEDNPVNAEVAVRMLERLGCVVEVVTDGAQAVAAVRRGRYDLVLMDCDMPVLDGYGATRAIRAEKDERSRSMPVVALTAAVQGGDRLRCFAAGMDDHLAKPTTIGELRAALLRWTESPDASAASSDLALDDVPALVGFGSDDGAVPANLAALFATTTATQLDDLREAVASDQLAVVAKLAHTVAGSASVLGALRVLEVSRRVELAAGEGDDAAVAALVLQLATEVEAASAAMLAASAGA